MKLTNYYNELILVENKKQAKQIISSLGKTMPSFDEEKYNYLMKLIEEADPSNNNKYMGRIAKWFIYFFNELDQWIETEVDKFVLNNFKVDINEHLSSFHHFAEMANPPEKFRSLTNIDSKEWNDYDVWKIKFLKFANEYNKSKVNTKEGKRGQQVLFEDDKVIVYKITSKQGMAYCGKDAPWCVTMPASGFYDHYINGGKYYFLVLRNKEIPITEEMLEVGHGGKGQVHSQFSLPNKEGYAMIALLIDSEFNVFSHNNTFTDFGNNTKGIDLVNIESYNSIIGYDLNELLENLGINDLNNKSEEELINLVNKISSYIRYIDNPSEQVQLAAIKVTSYSIRHIDNPSEEIQLEAVTTTPDSIQYIDNPSEKVQIEAVKLRGYFIRYIKNPSEIVQIRAITTTPDSIEFIKNPSEKIQLAAVNQSGFAINYIDNPSEKIQLAAVKRNGNSIQYIKNPSEEVQLAAVKKNGISVTYIINPSEKVQLTALNTTPDSIEYTVNPTTFTKYYYERKYENKEPYNTELEKKYQHYINTGELLNEHYQRIKQLF